MVLQNCPAILKWTKVIGCDRYEDIIIDTSLDSVTLLDLLLRYFDYFVLAAAKQGKHLLGQFTQIFVTEISTH